VTSPKKVRNKAMGKISKKMEAAGIEQPAVLPLPHGTAMWRSTGKGVAFSYSVSPRVGRGFNSYTSFSKRFFP
jgi:hypothetical protein